MADARRLRVERLLEAARTLQAPATPEGVALRARLLQTSGLTRENIELGLTRCLETQPTERELAQLLAGTPEAAHAHVLLSGNVFVAALRAIALGVASSARVSVRASRRDPALAEALRGLAPELFELVDELRPAAGERFWGYGSTSTLEEVRRTLPPGVWFHAHGSGMGAVVLDAERSYGPELGAIALDTALFDQRGCLSPRLVCVLGETGRARAVAQMLAVELAELEKKLPRGAETAEEQAESRRQRDAALYAFELFEAAGGWVSFSAEAVVPPSGRHLHVFPTLDPIAVLAPYRHHLTCIGTNTGDALAAELGRTFAGARVAALGEMQRPPLDGPVDRRHGTAGELLGA